MNDIENSRNFRKKNKNNNFSPDNDDIIKQLSQITSNEDKSFESSLTSKNIPILYEMNNFSKDVTNNNLSEKKGNFHIIKNFKNNSEEENTLINNKYFPLNQKLKYLCSLIQINNINIKKYEDLKDFNRYFSNDNLKPNQFEPINILFDIISELIFYIQRETKNNDIFMKEIKIIKQKRTEQEYLIAKLKSKIEEKEKEIKKMIPINNDDYYKYDLQEKEINNLKKENMELYQKINIYMHKIQKLETNNNFFLTQFESFNTKKNDFNHTLTNDLNNRKNILNLYSLNNSCDNPRINLTMKNRNTENNNRIQNLSKVRERNSKYINFAQYFSPRKTLYNDLSPTIKRNLNIENKNNDKNVEDGSIIIKLKLLLKEINDMLNIYNSHLEKININNNINGNYNVKYINEFVNAMNDKINKLKNFTEINNDKSNVIYKKSIKVNTSRWKFRKKSNNKNNFKKINDNLNLEIKRRNTSSSLRKDLIFNKLLN